MRLTDDQINRFFAKLQPRKSEPAKPAVLREWPNKLGWDFGDVEIWKLSNCLRVVTPTRYANVSSTADPMEALELTNSNGLLIADLEQMQPWEADSAVLALKL